MKNNQLMRIFACCLVALLIVFMPVTLTACDNSNKDISRRVTPSFGGRSAYVFDNINGKSVGVETFYIHPSEAFENNPNIGQAVMLNDAIRYKEAHPDEEVYASITSYHLSVIASVCLDETSSNYLRTKALYNENFDSEGYVRIAYLPIKAAMHGVNVIVIGQIDANPVSVSENESKNDLSFENYYNDYLNKPTYIDGKVISDYLKFRVARWTVHDKSASDMMHLKSCSVSNYRDYQGNDHGSAIWLGSINLDGINYLGHNGNNGSQTGVIVSEHDDLRRVLWNYTSLMSDYCEQESVLEFRTIMTARNKQQIDALINNNYDLINKDEQIVYLGTQQDNIFELYFTPLAGNFNEWNTEYNPYSKYFSKLLPENNGRSNITLSWAIAGFTEDSVFSKTLLDLMVKAFTENPNKQNRLYLSLPYGDGDRKVNYNIFDKLIVGNNIGFKKFDAGYYVHSKDIQMSYVEDKERKYVSILNSLNFHQGSAFYQTNSFLVIKENNTVGNNIYTDFGKYLSEGAITENDRLK